MAKILVLDDDAGVREMIGAVLACEGHQVTALPDGRAGLRSFSGETPDLVITDMVMPERDGIEMIRGVRRLDANVPILAISGNSRRGHAASNLDAACKLGATSSLAKPFGASCLRDAVARLLPPETR